MDLYTSATKAGTYPAAGVLTDQIMSLYDITKPQHYPQLVKRYGNQYENFLMFFQNLGRMEATPNDTFYGWEQNWIHDSVKVKVGCSAPAGQDDPATIQIDPADYNGAGTAIYPRVGDIITLPNEMQVRISAKTYSSQTGYWSLTLVPRRTDQHGIPAIANGAELAITSGAFGYGTGQPEGVTVGLTQRGFQAQIIKEEFQLEGQEFTRENWIEVPGSGGYYTTGISDAEYRLGLKWDGAILVGEQDDGYDTVEAGVDGAGNVIKSTRGIIPTIRSLGKTIETNTGYFDMDYLDQSSYHMKQNGATTNIALAIVGDLLQQEIENQITGSGGFLEGTNIDYTRVENEVFKGNRELSVSLNIRYITKGGITWMLHPHTLWSNPKTYAIPGYKFPYMGILFPWGTVKDAKTGMRTMNMGMKYLAKNGYSRKIEVWPTKGAGGGTYVHAIDRADYHLRSHMMFYMFAANQGIILDPLSDNVSISA